MKVLFFIYQWFIAAPIILVATIITAIVTMVGCLFNSNYWGYYPAKWWSRLWCAIHFVRIEVHGRERVDRNTSYVFVANHQGAYDIFTVYGYLGHPFKWMMRKGITNIPLVGTACRAAGHILVDTKSAGGVRHTIEDAEEKLDKGMSLVVFPEGRRTDTGVMGPFKPGAFRLALKFGLPIVPMTIDGSFRVMPRSTFNARPGKIVLTLHEPIVPETFDNDADSISREARAAIESALPQ